MPTPSTDRALKLKEEFQSIRQAAIDEQKTIIKEAESRLSELGSVIGPSKAQKPATEAPKPKKPCPRCGSLEHDGRFHLRRAPEQSKAAHEGAAKGQSAQ